jgi:hypothetical protein
MLARSISGDYVPRASADYCTSCESFSITHYICLVLTPTMPFVVLILKIIDCYLINYFNIFCKAIGSYILAVCINW